MVISAQVSIYPLRQEHLSPAIEALSDALKSAGMSPEVGSMSTMITGEANAVFAALYEGFVRATAAGHVVMTVTFSNACPVKD
jgi:uncharacterized protein YqgV (UPF0045/DUF77 family)